MRDVAIRVTRYTDWVHGWTASVKACYGHTEGAAGIHGVLLGMLAAQKATIPPVMHLQRVNPYVMTALDDWKTRGHLGAVLPRVRSLTNQLTSLCPLPLCPCTFQPHHRGSKFASLKILATKQAETCVPDSCFLLSGSHFIQEDASTLIFSTPGTRAAWTPKCYVNIQQKPFTQAKSNTAVH